MEHENSDIENAEEHATAAAEQPGAVARDRRTWLRGLGIALVVVAVLVIGFDLVTASPRLCASCHEMKPRAAAWARSAHTGVKCWQCHQEPRPWYAYPVKLVDRTKLLARDIRAHQSRNTTAPVDSRVPGTAPMKDEVCLQCHSANRKATSGFRIKINHVEHAKRNGSCVSCHVRTAHTLPGRSNPLTLMSQCFTCHGTAEKPEASAACSLCHPQGYKLLPESHQDAQDWKQQHAVTAKADPKQCEMCHDQSFCDDCHGLEMPHPSDWVKGEEGHAAFAETNRAVCTKCHTEKPDLCSQCHHKAYDPTVGSWVKQHPLEVETHGTKYCMDCHAPSYCVLCHVSWATTGELTP